MEIIISVQVKPAEAYNIIIDNEQAAKIRGNKITTVKLSNDNHTLQIKSMNGKSSLIKINQLEKQDKPMSFNFITNWSKAFKEGYYELEVNN